MLKRDSLTAQMQQLSHTLAKVKRLVVDGEIVEANKTIDEVLDRYYGTGVADLLDKSIALFRKQVNQQQFAAEELARLADFIDMGAELEPDESHQRALWEKVMVLYDVLEEDYQTVSFDHIIRRATLAQRIDPPH